MKGRRVRRGLPGSIEGRKGDTEGAQERLSTRAHPVRWRRQPSKCGDGHLALVLQICAEADVRPGGDGGEAKVPYYLTGVHALRV